MPFDLRRVVKHLQITAINAWTVHKFYPLIQHILLGGSFKSKHAINVLFTHTVRTVHPVSVHLRYARNKLVVLNYINKLQIRYSSY